ncbi:hypothetical protein [Mycobacterium sp.]|uniref:hypothetical protein n=1 Tax=Mycobacterium sp. TaxID=1785 RepID=UPI003C790C55
MLASAVERARQAREGAEAEDKRLTELAAEMNNGMLTWEKERLISPPPINRGSGKYRHTIGKVAVHGGAGDS